MWGSLTSTVRSPRWLVTDPHIRYDEPTTIQHWQLRDLVRCGGLDGDDAHLFFASDGCVRRLDLRQWRSHVLADKRRAACPAEAESSATVPSRDTSVGRDPMSAHLRERYVSVLQRELRGVPGGAAPEARRLHAERLPATLRAEWPRTRWPYESIDDELGQDPVVVDAVLDAEGEHDDDEDGEEDDDEEEPDDDDDDDDDDEEEEEDAPTQSNEFDEESAERLGRELLRAPLPNSASALARRPSPGSDARSLLQRPLSDRRYREVAGAEHADARLPGARVQQVLERLFGESRAPLDSRWSSGIPPAGGPTGLSRAQDYPMATSAATPNRRLRARDWYLGQHQEQQQRLHERRRRQQQQRQRPRRPRCSRVVQALSFWPTCLTVHGSLLVVGGQSGQLVLSMLHHDALDDVRDDTCTPPSALAFTSLSERAYAEALASTRAFPLRAGRGLAHPHELFRTASGGGADDDDDDGIDDALEGDELEVLAPELPRSRLAQATRFCTPVVSGTACHSVNNSVAVSALHGAAWGGHDRAEGDGLRTPLYLLVSTNDQAVKIFDIAEWLERAAPASVLQRYHDSPGAGRNGEGARRRLVPWSVLPCPCNINHTAVSPDGKCLVAVGDSSEVFLFHSASSSSSGGAYERAAVLREARDAGMSAAWHPSGRQFAVASQDGLCCVWDARYLGKTLARYPTRAAFPMRAACRNVKFSPAAADTDLLVFAEHQNCVHVACTRTYTEHTQTVWVNGRAPPTGADEGAMAGDAARATPADSDAEEHISGVAWARSGQSLVVATEARLREFVVNRASRQVLHEYAIA